MPLAVAAMEARVQAIREAGAAEKIWLLEHLPLYTAGTSAKPADLLSARFPVHATGRGGQYTYHGPGQRVAYAMLDLQKRGPDLRRYIWNLEEWLILALHEFDVQAERRDGRVGLWIDLSRFDRAGEAKIAAIGVRVRKWVTYHGVAVNVAPELAHYAGIVPCGIAGHGVTSLADLGIECSMADMDVALHAAWPRVFG